MELSLNPTEWYMKLLAPLSSEVKLDLISKLSESLKNKVSHTENKVSKSDGFFDTLSSAWDDGTSVEEEMQIIKDSRTSNRIRKIDKF